MTITRVYYGVDDHDYTWRKVAFVDIAANKVIFEYQSFGGYSLELTQYLEEYAGAEDEIFEKNEITEEQMNQEIEAYKALNAAREKLANIRESYTGEK